jgi:hypothetical protein
MQANMDSAAPRDPLLWQHAAQALAATDELRETVIAAGYSDDAAELVLVNAERAALASLLPARAALIAPALREGAACGAAAALCTLLGEGEIAVRLAEDRQRVFTTGGRTGMNAPRWALALGLAGCVEAHQSIKTLTHPPTVAACQESLATADEFWTGYCVALAATYRNDPAAASLLRVAIAGLASEHLRIADAEYVEGTRSPVLGLALAIAERGDAQGELNAALAAHARYYGTGAGRGERIGLLAFELAGLCALARRRGLDIDTAAALFAPVSNLPAQPEELEYRFPPLRLIHDGEAHWFLDFHGFPRETRQHQIVDENGVLVARYTAAGAPGLPRAIARLALTGEGLKSPDWPLALDAGQLVDLYGQIVARIAQDDARDALLSEAEALLDAIESRLPPQGENFDPGSLRSELSQALWRQAPHFFSREWLEAQRKMLKQPVSADREEQAQAQAFATMSVICDEVSPLLQALGQDDGSLTAGLRPREEDYAKAFLPPYAQAAKQAYEEVWKEMPRVSSASPAATLKCHVSPAGMLADDNSLSWHFPRGYRMIAPLLDPHRIWVAWKLIPPGKDAGMAYDGLVWLDERWVWFPRPYRVLRHLVEKS